MRAKALKVLIPLAGGAIGVMMLMALALAPAETAAPCAVVGRPATLPEIPEASGLAIGRRNPGVIWSHNDSGNAAVLFALDTTGSLRGRVRVPVRTRDWEDVSAARCATGDCLDIADIGDNSLARRRIQIYRVPEPAPGDDATAEPEVFHGVYADGPHNAEAMFVIGADMFIVTRDRSGIVYRSTHTEADRRTVMFERIGELGLAAVTDAEATPDEKSVAVRTSHEVVLYRTTDLIRGRDTPYQHIPIDGLREAHGEGVALDSAGTLYLASEGGLWSRAGTFIRLRCGLEK